MLKEKIHVIVDYIVRYILPEPKLEDIILFLIAVLLVGYAAYIVICVFIEIAEPVMAFFRSIIETFYNLRYWFIQKYTIYGHNNKYFKPIAKSKVALILEPVKEIYIRTEQDAARVFYRLMHFNKYFLKLSLLREFAMVLLLDKYDKLLVAVISSTGDHDIVIHNVEDVVYSYNASFGDCAKVVFAHTHVPACRSIGKLGRKIHDTDISLSPSHEDVFEVARLLNTQELQGMLKYCMILPGLPKRRLNYYTVLDLEKVRYYSAEGLLGKIDPERVARMIIDEDYKRELELMPAENFDVVYDATEKDEELNPTLVGIKLKYKKMPGRIISQAEGLKRWIEKQKALQKS